MKKEKKKKKKKKKNSSEMIANLCSRLFQLSPKKLTLLCESCSEIVKFIMFQEKLLYITKANNRKKKYTQINGFFFKKKVGYI